GPAGPPATALPGRDADRRRGPGPTVRDQAVDALGARPRPHAGHAGPATAASRRGAAAPLANRGRIGVGCAAPVPAVRGVGGIANRVPDVVASRRGILDPRSLPGCRIFTRRRRPGVRVAEIRAKDAAFSSSSGIARLHSVEGSGLPEGAWLAGESVGTHRPASSGANAPGMMVAIVFPDGRRL